MLIPVIQLKAFIIEAFVVVLPLPGASILRSCPGGRGVHSARVTHLVDEQRYRDEAERYVAGLVEPQV